MKKTLVILGTLAVIAASLVGCGPNAQQANANYQATQQNVQVYRIADSNVVVNVQQQQTQPNNNSDLTWLYWYMFMCHGNYYYCSSPTPISVNNFSSATWSSSKTEPEAVQDAQTGKAEVQQEPTEQVSNEELGQQVEAEMAENGYTPESDEQSSEPAESTSESSGESSSGESSGGDSGGGDSGGGGGGGD